MLTREKYVTQVLNNVKDTVLGKSNKNLFSFFVQHEELSDDELLEILEIIQNKIHPAP
jgi:predicted transcriptional regulator